MNRWGVRIAGILLLLIFALVFAQMHSALKKMAEQQQNAAPPR